MANMTIDDADPSVIYLPETAWNVRSASVPCSTCTANPNADLMFDDTFHDGTFNPVAGSNDFPNVPLTASVLFNGTAVYVFCALAESSTSPDGDSDMSFYIDGVLKGTFVKTAPGNANVYDYAVPVFVIESLTPEEHSMTLQNGHVNGTKALVLLDEIVYTAINTTTSSSLFTTSISSASSSSTSSGSNQGLAPSSSTPLSKQSHSGVIIGVTVSAAVLLIAALALGWLLKRRKRYDAPATSDPMTSALESRAFQVQSFGLTSPGLSGVLNSQLDSSRHGTVSYGTAGSSNISSVIAKTPGVDSSRRIPVTSTNLSTASAGTSRNRLDGDDSPDDAPPAYDELGARTSMRIGGRKARILAPTRP